MVHTVNLTYQALVVMLGTVIGSVEPDVFREIQCVIHYRNLILSVINNKLFVCIMEMFHFIQRFIVLHKIFCTGGRFKEPEPGSIGCLYFVNV